MFFNEALKDIVDELSCIDLGSLFQSNAACTERLA